jgi:hypothetical protein
VTLAVTVPERSGAILPCESNHKEGIMSATTIDRHGVRRDHTDRDRDRGPERRSWVWALVEALAYAGAAVDPAAALAATRLARIRDQQLGRGQGDLRRVSTDR